MHALSCGLVSVPSCVGLYCCRLPCCIRRASCPVLLGSVCDVVVGVFFVALTMAGVMVDFGRRQPLAVIYGSDHCHHLLVGVGWQSESAQRAFPLQQYSFMCLYFYYLCLSH